MKTPEQLLEIAAKKADEVKSDSRVVLQMSKKLANLKKEGLHNLDGETISKEILHLSGQMVYLSGIVTEWNSMADFSYVHRKWRRSDEYFKLRKITDKAVKDCEMGAEKNIEEELEKELANKYIADKLKGFYDAMNLFIMAMMARLRYLEGERIKSK